MVEAPDPLSAKLPEWVPDWARESWDGFVAMSADERAAFAHEANNFDTVVLGLTDEEPARDLTRQREFRNHCFVLFTIAFSDDLAKVMSAEEGRDVILGEAGVLIATGCVTAAQMTGFRLGIPGRGVVTAADWKEWFLLLPPETMYRTIRNIADNFIHLARGEKPKKFGKGWKKKRP